MLLVEAMRLSTRSGLVALAILGAASSVGTAAPKLTVSVNTTQVGGQYAPANVVAVWIEGPSPAANNPGPFVKTIGRWAGQRAVHLVAWRAKAGINDADAVSGATRADHSQRLTIEWDLKDKLGNLVPDGLYTVRMETADQSSSTTTENWQGTFTFTKGLARDMKTIADDLHYMNVAIDFDPTFGECNNGVVDPGETCDPPGSCPATCEDITGDACRPNVISGSSATCTSVCAVQTITACVTGDGCCAEGCTPQQDDDCFSDEVVDGGCAAGTGESNGALVGFALLGALGIGTLRRRS